MSEPKTIAKRFSEKCQKTINRYKNPNANNIKSIKTMQKYIDLIPEGGEKDRVLEEWEGIKKDLQSVFI